MPFIKQIKTPDKAQVKFIVSKHIADEFNKQLDLYQQKKSINQTLDFDLPFKKLIKELEKINNDNILPYNN